MLYDITPLVSPTLAVFPGDTPLSREILLDTTKGDPLTLSTLRATVHLGAHADAPRHYDLAHHNQQPAPTIEQMPISHYLGPCHVVDAKPNLPPSTRLKPADLTVNIDDLSHPRILIRTRSYPDPDTWTDHFIALSVELIRALADLGVTTLGIDTPSVDTADSKDLPAHHAILTAGIAIIEGLVLDAVPDAPGHNAYELIALPLKLVGFDASPVRAVLRTID